MTAAQRAAWAERRLPEVDTVAPGAFSIPVPVPELPIRFTYCYALVGDDGVLLVDPGWDAPEGAAALAAGLTRCGLSVDDVIGVVVTHMHRDHVGLVGAGIGGRHRPWLAAGTVARSVIDGGGPPTTAAEYRHEEGRTLAAYGIPVELRADLALPDEGVASIVGTPRPDLVLADGDLLPLCGRRIRVLATPGHTDDSICLADDDADLLLTGDTLLPRISPNIGWTPDGAPDPLGDYLAALARLGSEEHREALPGHEWRFRGIRARTEELAAHHAARLEEVAELRAAQGPDTTAWRIASALRWARPWAQLSPFQQRIATAEAAAHLARTEPLSRAGWRAG